MERWEWAVKQLAEEYGFLTEARVETLLLRNAMGVTQTTVAEKRGVENSSVSVMENRATRMIEDLREGLRLYDIYTDQSYDVREGDELWLIPDSWTQTNYVFATKDPLIKKTIYRLPNESFAKIHYSERGYPEDRVYQIEKTGEKFVPEVAEIDWETFDDALHITTVDDFRDGIERTYKALVKRAVREWLENSPPFVQDVNLKHQPHLFKVNAGTVAGGMLEWGNLHNTDGAFSEAERVDNLAYHEAVEDTVDRWLDYHQRSDIARESFPGRVGVCLNEATPGGDGEAFDNLRNPVLSMIAFDYVIE